MHIQNFSSVGATERVVLTSLVVDPLVLSRVASIWNGKLFGNPWANTVAGWCVSYFNTTGEAPGPQVTQIYQQWAETAKPEDAKHVHGFLTGLSQQMTSGVAAPHHQYVITQAGELFNRVRLERTLAEVQATLQRGTIAEAQACFAQSVEISLGENSTVDVLTDEAALIQAFSHAHEAPLISYDGTPLAAIVRRAFDTDSFVGFMAPEKRGKTQWLMELAFAAVKQNRQVAFFAVGDMSQDQMMERFAAMAAMRSLIRENIKLPNSLRRNPDTGLWLPTFDEVACTGLPVAQAREALLRINMGRTVSPLKLSVHPNTTLTVAMLEAKLEQWRRELGWVPGVVVVDYADILAPDIKGDTRDQIDDTWRRLKGVSQKYRCCVITATQTNRESAAAVTLQRVHVSEDKRKFAHVSAMFGINQTPQEKAAQVFRLNCLALRNGGFNELHCVAVAGCPQVYRPMMVQFDGIV